MVEDVIVEADLADIPHAKVLKAMFKKAEIGQAWAIGPHDVRVLADFVIGMTAVNNGLTEKLIEYERMLTAVSEAPKRKLLKGVDQIWKELKDGQG